MADELNSYGGVNMPGIPINGTTGGRVQQISGDVLFAGNVEIRAGRFIAATEDSATLEPTDIDFSGCFISAEGETFGDSTYNIGGVNAGVLQFGLDAATGKAYFMGGAAIMDDGGINLTGVGNLITMEGSTETATRHVNIGMEIGPDTGVPSLTIKSYSPDYGSNLLTNGTFESDTVGSTPANWTNNYTVVQSASGTFVSKFLRFSYSGYNDRNDYSDAINVTEGTTYYFIYHAYIYALAGSPSNIAWSRLRIAWYDVSDALISTVVVNQAYSISDTPDYHDIHAVWSGIAPTGAVTAKINLNYWGKRAVATTPIGYIHVDDLTFCDLSGEATYQIQFDPELTVDGGLTVKRGAVNTALITLTEGADPSSPSAGYRALYAKSDGVYQKVSGGTASRLALASEIPTLTYPKRFSVMGDEITTSVTMTFSLIPDGVNLYNGIFGPTVENANNGDEYTFSVFIEAGNYTFYHLGRKVTDGGKLDWYVDGSSVATGRDWYAAKAATYTDSFAVTIASSGYHVIKIKVNGKNASSRDYRATFAHIWGKQATD